MKKKVGHISTKIAKVLELDIHGNPDIFIGETNIQHIKNKHPEDFKKYGHYLQSILKNPDYVGVNPKDNSIEYVKEFHINQEFVKVAVRVAGSGTYFVRSLYVLNQRRTLNFISKGTLKPVK